MALRAYINDEEYKLNVKKSTFKDQASGIAVSPVVVEVQESQDIPKSFDIFEIKDNVTDEPFFLGVVQTPESPTYETGFERDEYKINVQSANAILNNREWNEGYQNKTVTEIVTDGFNKIISEEGITLGMISDIDFEFEDYRIPRFKVTDVLDELSDYVGATWYVSPDKKFYFLTQGDFTTVDAPEKITVKIKENALDVRTIQTITEVDTPTATQNESIAWATDQSSYPVGYPIKEEPTITINGSPATVGLNGIDSDDTSVTFLWTYNSQTINLNASAVTQPSSGDTVATSYIGLFKVDVSVQNDSKIAEIAAATGLSGKIERSKKGTTVKTATDATNTATALLEENGEGEFTVTSKLKTLDDTNIYTTYSYANVALVGDYTIVGRSFKLLYDNGDDIGVRVTLTLKNKKFVMKQGSVYNTLSKDIRGLSVREDSVIIKTQTILESMELSEEYDVQSGSIPFYPVSAGSSDLVAPSTLMTNFYPIGG